VITRSQLIEQLGTVDEKWSDQDLAVRAVLLNSYCLVTLGARTFTDAEKYEPVNSYLMRADRLRAEAAALLEEGEDSEAAEHARAIERAAAFCEREAYDVVAAFEDDNPPEVERHQVPPHVRGFCMRLAEAMRYIYGDTSYGTVASIATAAFNQTISKENVVLRPVLQTPPIECGVRTWKRHLAKSKRPSGRSPSRRRNITARTIWQIAIA